MARKILPESASAPDSTEDRKREGVSTVNLNHPLAVNPQGSRRIMRKLQFVFMTLTVLCFAIPAFADGGSTPVNLVPIGAGIGMAIAAGLCGLGQGRATASATEALARNPGARAGIQLLLVLGLAFIESLTLFTLVIICATVK
jgi:F-type H+-transporting ATPase subunit c